MKLEKATWLRRLLLWGLCIVLPLSFVTLDIGTAYALHPVYERAWEQQLRFLALKDIAYRDAKLGPPYDDPSKGLNCTSYLWLAAKWAGIPGVQLTQSRNMAEAGAGWVSSIVPDKLRSVQNLDLGFFTFTPKRPNGHAGAFLRTRDGMPAVAHASTGKGKIVIEEVARWVEQKLTRVRRITIGD